MKKQPFNYLMAGLVISLFPAGAYAAETVVTSSTGISDTFLLTALVSVILLLLLIVHAMGQSIQSIGKIKTAEEKEAEKNAGTIAKTVAVLLMAGTSVSAYAADGATSAPFVMSDVLFWSLITIIAFLAMVIAILFRSLKTMIRYKRGDNFQEEEEQWIFDVIGSKFTDNVPVEEEVTVMLDHEYDGIRELDNNLPPWWKYMFYATIVFAFVYIIRFHITGGGELQLEEYNNEMLAATEAKAEALESGGEQITEDNVTLLVDLDALNTGANIYKGNCATCHGALAEGIVGPNLTDEYWIHGGGINNVFKIIKYGVPAKGMIAWQSQFSPTQMQEVASYIISLQGSNPTNPKDPQGEIWVEEEAAPDATATDSTDVDAPAEDITADLAE
tara:strand:+ start:1174 stop:2337 length:1164 start_codon:yes stop_codon:yes gene_type:complete